MSAPTSGLLPSRSCAPACRGSTLTLDPRALQIFVGGEFIGGSDILYQMHQSGELETQLKEAVADTSTP